MAADKTISFSIDITGVSNEANELAKIELQLKNIKREKQDLEKIARSGFASGEQIRQLAAYNTTIKQMEDRHKELKKVVDSAPDSLNRMRAELSKLKNEYANGSAEIRNNLAPQINKLTTEVSKAEQAIGVHQRGVGNYKGGIMEAAKELLGFGGAVALGTAALNKMKQAFQETELGARVTKQWAEGIKTFFNNIIQGQFTFAGANALVAAELAKQLDDIRKGDREDLIKIAQLEGEIHHLRLLSVDATLSTSEQLKYLTEAEAKEAELIAFKIADRKEELNVLKQMSVVRENDTVLLDRIAQIEAEIIGIENEQSLRIASKKSALREKEQKEIEAGKKKEAEQEKELTEAVNKYREERAQFYKNLIEEEQKAKEKQWNWELELGRAIVRKDEEAAELEWDKIQKQAKNREDLEKKKEETITSFKRAGLEGAEIAATSIFAAKRTRLEAEMQAELNNANLTESQKDGIRRKYAKQQQAIDVSQAIINGALAVGNALATTKPFIPAGLIAAGLATVQSAFQIATIKAQKYATGGLITGGLQIHSDTSRDNTLAYVMQGETILNKRQVSMLGGSGMMKRIGVPGYADGGYIGQQTPNIPAMGFDYAQLARMMGSMEVKLDINKVNSAQREVSIINEPNRI